MVGGSLAHKTTRLDLWQLRLEVRMMFQLFTAHKWWFRISLMRVKFV